MATQHYITVAYALTMHTVRGYHTPALNLDRFDLWAGWCRPMPNLLFEVGMEELPADAAPLALQQLGDAISARLEAARLGGTPATLSGTPRRIAVQISGVPARQTDAVIELKGPATAIAFSADGSATGAAVGFARKAGVPVTSLRRVDTPQGEYVFATISEPGRPALDVLGALLTDALMSIYFPKMMRWGGGAMRFARPLRWLTALLDGDVIPLEIAGVTSGRCTWGHRFLAPGPVELATASDYPHAMEKCAVISDPTLRAELIRSQADQLVLPLTCSVMWDEDLLAENNWLVEYPTVLIGTFNKSYLELPTPVLITAMKKHQRFFPVVTQSGALAAMFVSVRNGGTQGLDTVRTGNERVLAARFADARYFFSRDSETPFDKFCEQLGKILFHQKLGTLGDKRDRLRLAVASAGRQWIGSGVPASAADRAAELCKADLATQMVMELPALQGVIGGEYARAAGEGPEVAVAIAEHYLPRSAADSLPQSRLGRMLAVVDRMDTLVGYLSLGIVPTGSSDPYGLRRAAHAIVQVLAEEPAAPLAAAFAAAACDAYTTVNGMALDENAVAGALGPLLLQRQTAYLEERGVRYDLADAALADGSLCEANVFSMVRRALALNVASSNAKFESVLNAASRVARILSSAALTGHAALDSNDVLHLARASMHEVALDRVDRQRFTHQAEHNLWNALSRNAGAVAQCVEKHDYSALFPILTELTEPVDLYFDAVLVMDPDPELRAEKLTLLGFVDTLFSALADFTKVVQAEARPRVL